MAANRTWEAQFPYQTRITTLATNTTLGTATEHDFADVDVRLPENAVIRFACVVFTFSDSFAAAADIDGFRVGIQVDAVGFSDVDTAVTIADSGDHTRFKATVDVTSYLNTNMPGDGGPASVGVRARVATESAQNVNGVAAKLIITYAFDKADSIFYPDDGENEVVGGWVKTVAIPIQSHHTNISTSYVETGTTGGVYDAPANQIPALETYLTDCVGFGAGVAGILATWVELEAQTLAGASDVLLTTRFDGATDVPRYTVESSSLQSNVTYEDRITLGGVSLSAVDFSIATNSVAAFEAKSDNATTFERLGGFLFVTYVVDPTATIAFNSVRVPMDNGKSETTGIIWAEPTGGPDFFHADINIQEPGPIVMAASAFCLYGQINNTTKSVQFPGTSVRAYTGASSAVRDGAAFAVSRFDHADPTDTLPSFCTIDLMRGFNRIPIEIYASTFTSNATNMGGYAVVNYYSGVAVDASDNPDPWSHGRTLTFPIVGTYEEQTSGNRVTSSPTAPVIVEDYTLMGSWAFVVEYGGAPGNTALAFQRAAGEMFGLSGFSGGWERVRTMAPSNMAENGPKQYMLALTDKWREHRSADNGIDYLDLSRHDIEAQRDWYYYDAIASGRSILHHIAIHSITYQLAGTYLVNGVGVTGTGVAPSGGYAVEVSWRDLKHTRGGLLRRNVPVTTGDWSTTVYDDTLIYKAVGRNGLNDTQSAGAEGFINTGRSKEPPKVVGVGAYNGTSATFDLPAADHEWGDLIVLFVESTNGNDVPTPSGFAICPDSPQEIAGTQLSVFIRQAKDESVRYNEIADPTITAAGFTNHASGAFVVVRGANMDDLFFGGDVASALSAIDDTEGGTSTTDTAVSVAGATTTEDQCLVLVATTHDRDTVASTDQVLNSWANSNLEGLRGIIGNGTSAGDGGGISVARGIKRSTGAIGATTATLQATSTQAKICIAIKPQSWAPCDFALAYNSPGGGAHRPIGSPLVRRLVP